MWTWETKPYNSFGNGSAMQVSPVGFAFDTADEVLRQAKCSAEVSHNHPEGIRGTQATALEIFMARQGVDQETIRKEIADRFGYDLDRTVEGISPAYSFDVSCQGSVPESIVAFLDSVDYETAIINAISFGGDPTTWRVLPAASLRLFAKRFPHGSSRKSGKS